MHGYHMIPLCLNATLCFQYRLRLVSGVIFPARLDATRRWKRHAFQNKDRYSYQDGRLGTAAKYSAGDVPLWKQQQAHLLRGPILLSAKKPPPYSVRLNLETDLQPHLQVSMKLNWHEYPVLESDWLVIKRKVLRTPINTFSCWKTLVCMVP